jgi:protein-L-isoaspartate O-methyltransferase
VQTTVKRDEPDEKLQETVEQMRGCSAVFDIIQPGSRDHRRHHRLKEDFMAEITAQVDVLDLERRVKGVYRDVARHPRDMYHFEMGRALAVRLGYPPELLDRVPPAAVESFAGVGYYFDLARPTPGERVLDLGSGSGMDSFALAHLVGTAAGSQVST